VALASPLEDAHGFQAVLISALLIVSPSKKWAATERKLGKVAEAASLIDALPWLRRMRHVS
jgi:hypothetical protein